MNIEIPSAEGKPTVTISPCGRYRAIATILRDYFAENPLDVFDGYGHMRSFSRKHTNFCDRNEFEYIADCNGADLVLLSYFEHGNCLWGVRGTMSNMPDFQWDGVETAGFWVPDAELIDTAPQFGPERRAYMEARAAEACRVYTDWCNGETYGYSLEIVGVRNNLFAHTDSCSGFYGWDEVATALQDAASCVK